MYQIEFTPFIPTAVSGKAIGECDQRRRWEKQRRKSRAVFLELQRLRLAGAAIIPAQAMRERSFEIETQEARRAPAARL